MKKIIKCRCCGGVDLTMYLNLGKQPLANSYHRGEKLPKYPLEVMLCKNCFHSQLSVVINPSTMFKNYLYVSGTTQTFRSHCKNLAIDAKRRISERDINVLDIACNDGTLLEYFREQGCSVQGVDPAENLRPITLKKNISVIVDYWSIKIAKKNKNRFNIITATNVFAHADNIKEFLEACYISLNDKGLVVLEFPYANNMIENNEFDTVYHEHLSYFLVNSFKALVDQSSFFISDILQTNIHGGSIRFFLKKGKYANNNKTEKLIEEEKNKGLLSIKTYRKFASKIAENRKEFVNIVEKETKKEKKIIGYGASAKGNTMLNYFNVNFAYIVDDNPLKWGYITPGRNIPIYGPDKMKEEKKPLSIAILSWNFYEEIIKKIIKIRGKGREDSCLLYVPNISKIAI